MSRPSFVAWALVGLLSASLVGVTSVAASRALGTSFPSLFVDPYGGFSLVGLPRWQSAGMDIAVGAPIRPVGPADPTLLPADALSRAATAAAARGETSLRVRIGDAEPTQLALRTLGAEEVLWFYGLYVLAALLLLWSGVAVAAVAWQRPGGRAYCALASVGFVYLVTFLDYQTTRWLAPLFAASTLGNSIGLLALAWSFPRPATDSPRVGRAIGAALAVLAGLAVVLGIAVVAHVDLLALRQLADVAVPLSMLTLVVSIVWRLRSDPAGADHAELRLAARGLVVVPATFALAFCGLWLAGRASAFHMLLPFASIALPAAVGNALIRHNVLSIQTVITRGLMTAPLVLVAMVLGVGCAVPLWDTGPLPSIAVGAAITLTLSVLGWLGIGRVLARVERNFQPIVGGLADDVAALRTPDAIRGRLAELVQRSLTHREVRAVARHELAELPLAPAERERLERGIRAWIEGPRTALVVPLRFGTEPLGAVIVTPRVGDALFSDREIQVTENIVSLGALALHHAELLLELEQRRALELAATKEDKRLAVDLVAAEIAHELGYPIGFLRHFLKQVTQGRATPDAIEVGRDEVERLERMQAWVRKLQVPLPVVAQVGVRGVVSKVLMLLESDLESRKVECVVEVPEDLSVPADSDALLQLVANLLRNGVQHARARVGVSTRTLERGQTELCVWDDGPGVPPELSSRIFDPLFTTQSEASGHGLGLAVAQRVARSFGWSIEVRREDERTVFAVRMKRPTERLQRQAS